MPRLAYDGLSHDDIIFWAASWYRRHTNAYHPGEPHECPDCRAMIERYGPMPPVEAMQYVELLRQHVDQRFFPKTKMLPKKLRLMILERDNYTCQHCGSRDHPCIDHILPVVRGGSDDPSNLQVLCRSCNSRKGSR